jgi:competence protein ComGF
MKIFAILQKDKGFTFIEMLVSLVIFTILATLVLQLFLVINTQLNKESSIQPLEWEIFINQLKQEVRKSNVQEVDNGKILLQVDSNIVTIEKYQNMLRRRVNGTGHQVLLQNITGFQPKMEGNKIVITVSDEEGVSYFRRLSPLLTGGNPDAE